jgi:FAD/FMN-containing dehydrogenase
MQSPSWSYPVHRWRKLKSKQALFQTTIAAGGGRSYGDSNFKYGSQSTNISTKYMRLDSAGQILKVSAGTTIIEALNYLGLYGFELYVVPGTAYATIGGCVASDVHGKNSHKHGSFSRHLKSLTLLIGDQKLRISKSDSKLWRATIGGCGLTGIITECEIAVKPIKSGRLESTVMAINGLSEMFENLKTVSKDYDYAIGWLDGRYQAQRAKGFIHYANESDESSSFQAVNKSRNLISKNFPNVSIIFSSLLNELKKYSSSFFRISE